MWEWTPAKAIETNIQDLRDIADDTTAKDTRQALESAADELERRRQLERPKIIGLNFALLRATNIERALRWHKGGLDEWSVNDWLAAFAGEAGEACNAGKKHRRILSSLQQHGDVPADLDEAEARIMEELADAVIYADLVASRLGRRLADAIVAKFNAVSEREGFPERL